jgi:two-component system sensor histidine kinase PilS (NtrC family)
MTAERLPAEREDLDDRIKQLMALRVVMVTTLLAAALYVEAVVESLPSRTPLYGLIVATYLITSGYALALRWMRSREPLVFVQVIGDLLLITGLVYLTGISRAGFQLLYPIAVLSGAVLLYRRGGLILAALAVALYASLLWAVRAEWIAPQGLGEAQTTPAKALVYSVFVTGVACTTVAMVGSYLAQSLRRVGEQLEQATEEVADLRELNQIVVESIQSGLATVDTHGAVHYLSPAGEAILGVRAASVRGRPVAEVFGALSLDGATLKLRAGRRDFSRAEFERRRPDGVATEIGLSVSPLARGMKGYLLVFQDLTEIKRLEREVRTKEKLAAVGEMAAQVAHEIRNPLGSISGAAQVLLAGADIAPEQERLLSIIRRESQRLSLALDQFLLSARPAPLVKEPVDLRPVIEQAATLLRNGLREGSGQNVEFAADDGPHVCLTNANAVTQIFWNLARNGMEAMPAGGTLGVSLTRQNGLVLLGFKDEGCGMGRDTAGRLFKPLEPPSPGHAGLGLAIVYRLVRDLGGDIMVASEPERGTTVEVRLPLLGSEVSA